MRILFVSEYFPPAIRGGGEINLNLLAKALVKKGKDVFVITSYQDGLQRYEEFEGVKVYRLMETGENPGSVISNLRRALVFPKSVVKEVGRLCKRKKFDVIHFIGTSIIAAPKLKKLGIRLVATIESYPTLCPKGDRIYDGKKECMFNCSWRKFINCQKKSVEIGKMKNEWYLRYNFFFLNYVYNYYKRLNLALGSCNLVAISEYVKDLLLQQGYESVAIPNMIDADKFDVSGKEEKEDEGKNKVKIIYLGSLIKSKGPQVLLDSLKELDCNCKLYGDGVLKEELEKFIEENRLDAEICEPVPYEEIPRVYASADIVVFPSIWPEPFGRISIEAMAAGKPVVGSAMGGIKETIKNNGTGFLVEDITAEGFRKVIRILIEDGELRSRLGRNGKEMVKEYIEEKVIDNLINFYESVINK